MASFEIGAANGVSSSSNAGKSSGVQKQTPEYKIGENLNGQSQRPKTELPKTSDGDLDGKAIALKLNSLNNSLGQNTSLDARTALFTDYFGDSASAIHPMRNGSVAVELKDGSTVYFRQEIAGPYNGDVTVTHPNGTIAKYDKAGNMFAVIVKDSGDGKMYRYEDTNNDGISDSKQTVYVENGYSRDTRPLGESLNMEDEQKKNATGNGSDGFWYLSERVMKNVLSRHLDGGEYHKLR
ncbi:MAG: hypothetical protein SPL73_06470 [Cyanobacteriota bacterium]|nr:hypothetical protein [Cyanobacteriota bacterium]MDY6359155.1 hypothetical protein [Cyanobacteriota bacterium]MDY6364515.1 hypothetical protein [Cyanobacteriota bacterium]MDY6383159.1 hypothetical protein [Cyanobacteriota bacterium]